MHLGRRSNPGLIVLQTESLGYFSTSRKALNYLEAQFFQSISITWEGYLICLERAYRRLDALDE
jgi:hypothetical protein